MHPTRLRGARTHNLRAIDIDLEPGSMVVIAGPSGAGKSSLAFSTLYAEGQRRYVESFSPYARQFLERLPRPPVDELEPVPAGIAVDRQAPVKTSRSTVATMTDTLDYVKLLWARTAALRCPGCGEGVEPEGPEASAARLMGELAGERVIVTYPAPFTGAEAYLDVRDALVSEGYRRAYVGGETRDLDSLRPSEVMGSDAPLEVITDRLRLSPRNRSRLVEALESAMARGGGHATLWSTPTHAHKCSNRLRCDGCDLDFEPASPGLFSFNNPVGACDACRGFGRIITMDVERMIPDPQVSLKDGAISPWRGKSTAWERRKLKEHAAKAGVPLDVPVAKLSTEQQSWLIEGDERGWPKGWWGLRGWYAWLETRAYKMHVRVLLSRLRKYVTCPDCQGTRLKKRANDWYVGELTLPEFLDAPVSDALSFIKDLRGASAAGSPSAILITEIRQRLTALCEVGLGYLTLARPSRTLSGGETQRVALTGAIGTGLSGAMFVLDEPTVGLHPRDVHRLSTVLRRLTSGDNLAVIVEHDPAIIRGADRVIELGPGAGAAGGSIVFDGTPASLARRRTLTGHALRGGAEPRRERRTGAGRLLLRGARGNNLRDVDLDIPLSTFVCVTGVSGSGKSTLIMETLRPALMQRAGLSTNQDPLPHESLTLPRAIKNLIAVDQSPLGRTSRGTPATYLKLWDIVRKRFAAEALSRARGYKPGFFSFNIIGGRCETCGGKGFETVEMQFLADISFSCADCGGRRFRGPVLDVRLNGLNVADLLELTADEFLTAFAHDPDFTKCAVPLVNVGLGYLRLGQPLNTLSGGEAQRLKLAAALVSAGPDTLLILDEPTAGLHSADIGPLLTTLHALVDNGATIVCVEHDMSVAANADYIVDLGPGAGHAGGEVVASGPPERVAATPESATAPFLKSALGAAKPHRPSPAKKRRSRKKPPSVISVSGAREHNLRDVNVQIPRGKLVAVTGPSGSGKSTLAFDIVFAEGQRRYLETLSPYARQYMPCLPRPDVDRVMGVPPCVSLEQRTTRGGRNSTVATVTEVAHYLRLLWARAGVMQCPNDGTPITSQTTQDIIAAVKAKYSPRTKLKLLAPIIRGKKGHHREVLDRCRRAGFQDARIDGAWTPLTEGLSVSRYKEHDIDLVIAEVTTGAPDLSERIDEALLRGEGALRVVTARGERLWSSRNTCPTCDTSYPDLDPRFFSSNTRQGACEQCEGAGEVLPPRPKKVKGRRRKPRPRNERPSVCDACHGTGLSDLARSVRIGKMDIEALLKLSVRQARKRLPKFKLSVRHRELAEAPLGEALRRLEFLDEVGLGYLDLDRKANTLSGGELQRVRLAAQLGSGLTGALYVLDEPTIGLHPRDTGRLLEALRGLVAHGNTVLVVEHDADTIRAADHMIDIGPEGGRRGGQLLAEGPPARLLGDPRSVTGRSLDAVQEPREPRPPPPPNDWLHLRGASQHNLRAVNLKVPLGRLTAVSGVSGSGKSTLVREVLLPATRLALNLVTRAPGKYAGLEGIGSLKRAVEIDQSPIGRTPRSVPATYIGIWAPLRQLLAATPEARARGYTPSRFSFNVEEGRCGLCQGQGSIRVEMAFLPDVHVPCDRCRGLRFSEETMHVRLHGRSAGEILQMEVEEALQVFTAIPKVRAPLQLMTDLGLGYLQLGQASNTLSGGEAQRLKLVSELNTSGNQRTLYVMDEPTTGLHREDVTRLISLLHQLSDRGDTVVVIEHHPDVILAADWVCDLGPEGGEDGGSIIATGPPQAIMASSKSHTGAVLRRERSISSTRAR